jgi:hypothetical protein
MSDIHLRRKAHKIRGTKKAWWQERGEGVRVMQQFYTSERPPRFYAAESILIPWQALRGALARKDRP